MTSSWMKVKWPETHHDIYRILLSCPSYQTRIPPLRFSIPPFVRDSCQRHVVLIATLWTNPLGGY
ncbi:hypothetical protein M407DRAFT_142560 [Tulasnella calospora MUT 4182]|uniref:Uncharacterized protein n=1 Tax=Tulasnella calospora MUT 4182 TaxID=1051891 RepID=A0A0C3KEU8_9AGAM|nr:hypothetical protein M407DRAFT_142560 [Tulasnella calospora MUT 4182]